MHILLISRTVSVHDAFTLSDAVHSACSNAGHLLWNSNSSHFKHSSTQGSYGNLLCLSRCPRAVQAQQQRSAFDPVERGHHKFVTIAARICFCAGFWWC